jgi:hypothetical protein
MPLRLSAHPSQIDWLSRSLQPSSVQPRGGGPVRRSSVEVHAVQLFSSVVDEIRRDVRRLRVEDCIVAAARVVLRCVVVVEFAATFQLKRQHPMLFDCGPVGVRQKCRSGASLSFPFSEEPLDTYHRPEVRTKRSRSHPGLTRRVSWERLQPGRRRSAPRVLQRQVLSGRCTGCDYSRLIGSLRMDVGMGRYVGINTDVSTGRRAGLVRSSTPTSNLTRFAAAHTDALRYIEARVCRGGTLSAWMRC